MPLVPPYIESLRPYEAGRTIESVRKQYGLTRIAKLASNENPLGASPKAIEAMTRALTGLNLYPNGGLDLREVLAREFDVKVENVIAGSGSEGIMSNIIRAFLCDEDEVLTTEAAFIGFQVLARSRGVKYRTVPYRRLALRSAGAGRADQREHQDHLPGQPEQPHRHDLHPAPVRRVLPARAGARADHPGRSLLRVRQGQSALSRIPCTTATTT